MTVGLLLSVYLSDGKCVICQIDQNKNKQKNCWFLIDIVWYHIDECLREKIQKRIRDNGMLDYIASQHLSCWSSFPFYAIISFVEYTAGSIRYSFLSHIYIIEYENNFIIFRSIASAERIRLHSEEIRVEEKEKRSIEEIEKE